MKRNNFSIDIHFLNNVPFSPWSDNPLFDHFLEAISAREAFQRKARTLYFEVERYARLDN